MKKTMLFSALIVSIMTLQGCDSGKKTEEVKKDEVTKSDDKEAATLFGMGDLAKGLGKAAAKTGIGLDTAMKLTPKENEGDLLRGYAGQRATDTLDAGVAKARAAGNAFISGANALARKVDQAGMAAEKKFGDMSKGTMVGAGIAEAKDMAKRAEASYNKNIVPRLNAGADEVAVRLGKATAGSELGTDMAKSILPPANKRAFKAGQRMAE